MRRLILSLAAVSLVLVAEKALCRGTTLAIEPESFNSLSYQDFRVKEVEPRSIRTGRFLSVDPTWDSADLATPQSWNRYSYVMNNPINATDPDGRIGFFLLPPTMPFHLGLNHPKSEAVQRLEKAGLAVAIIALVAVVTRGEAIFGPSAGESEPPTPSEAYDRQKHYGRTPTAKDRKDLGAGSDEVVNHEPALVKRYYDGDPQLARSQDIR